MPSEYRLMLERKIDGIAALERSGYGATYGKARRAEVRRETLDALASFAAMLFAIAAWSALLLVLSV